MACCRCSYRDLCKGFACVKAGCACFNCLHGCDGHCLNPLSSSITATAPASMTLLKTHLTIDQSSPQTPDWNTSVSPCTDPLSPCSNVSSPSDRESIYGQTPACRLSCYTTLPFHSLSMCGSHIVPDFIDFSPMAEPNFLWNDINGESFSSLVKSCYDEVVQWRRNVFKVPYEKIGASFVHEQAKLFQAYSDSSALESIALYTAIIVPSLLLQRPLGKLRANELSRLLDRCLTIWLSGDLDSLLHKGCAIQARLTITCPIKIQITSPENSPT